ncbi:head maturation protease, ClpP-related [Lactococcus lactis]|uniref:ATP-dependent Clp protease proteolytic subunit n=1 Tax=Lactococcus lactis TaxID=1358 RepID=A0AAW5TFU4_9LACT|nr:head maturation protease, ClpP-related [Lactococcus lactis]MCW2279880.1 ATP-dependent protease ClpP protease subunit [Lactococcus lactis]MCW2280424.1 ATP-dependent protease ClpP protease subunit [Lactococcus lactis]
MKTLKFNGVVADNSDKEVYDWFGMECITPKMVSDFLNEAAGEDVTIQINSGGGSVFAGSEIFTDLSKYQGKVIAEISGICASAATFPLLAADKTGISPIGQVMIHNVSTIQRGDYRDMTDASKFLLGSSGNVAELYAKKMKVSTEKAQKMMDDETWFNAKEAVEAGIVDEILFEDNHSVKMVASLSPVLSPEKINQFKNLLKGEKKSSGTIDVHFDDEQMKQLTAMIDEKIAAVKAEIQVNNLADKPFKNQKFKPMFGGIN